MSNDNDTVDNSGENLAEDQAQKISAKDKILNFVKNNQQAVLIVSGALLFLLILWAVVYVFFLRTSDVEEYADKFCQCAAETEKTYYNYTSEGFGYRSDLNGCFAEEFKLYGEGFNRADKKKMLLKFQQQVIKKCPQKLAGIFEYK